MRRKSEKRDLNLQRTPSTSDCNWSTMKIELDAQLKFGFSSQLIH